MYTITVNCGEYERVKYTPNPVTSDGWCRPSLLRIAFDNYFHLFIDNTWTWSISEGVATKIVSRMSLSQIDSEVEDLQAQTTRVMDELTRLNVLTGILDAFNTNSSPPRRM